MNDCAVIGKVISFTFCERGDMKGFLPQWENEAYKMETAVQPRVKTVGATESGPGCRPVLAFTNR